MENQAQKEIPRFFKPGTQQEVILMRMFRELPREEKIGYHTFKSKAEGIYSQFYVAQTLLNEKLSKNKVKTNQKTFRLIVINGVAHVSKMTISEVKAFADLFPSLWFK